VISRLCGILLAKEPPAILLDVQGVGYEIDVPMSSFFGLPKLGETVTLYTHLAIREDAHQLFGFVNDFDRRLFRTLLKVNGIGARTALGILSGMNAQDVIQCVLKENISMLTKIPGIGRKTAERLVIELRDRLKTFNDPVTNTTFNGTVNIGEGSPKDDAINALVALGYKPTDAAKSVEKCYDIDHSSEVLIKLALQSMVR
jgi:holliday junction DNA helicase RuvA